MEPVPAVAVVGGGFSGTLLAVHLLRGARAPLRIVLFERGGLPGRGVAYGTAHRSHLLNVRSAGMSAFPEDPGHFVRWARGPGGLPESAPTDFLPRRLYGSYLVDLLHEAARGAGAACELRVSSEEVVDLEPGPEGASVVLAGGSRLEAARVALALGNLPGRGPLGDGHGSLYADNPWTASALEGIGEEAPVVVLGTGLTMVDLLLALRDRGHRGVVHAVSRRGLLPASHVPGPPPPPAAIDPSAVAPTAAAWTRRLRDLARGAADWRLAVDGIRPHAAAIWRSLPRREKARFLRHARPFWEVHRHRMAPPVAEEVAAARAEGRLVVHAGRVRIHPGRDGTPRVRVSPRGGGASFELPAARVLNATGPEPDLRRADDPLVRALLSRGAIRPDGHRLGLDANARGAVVGRDGRVSRVLFALGPLLRGVLWECTAVPEIRVQARDLAAHWLRALGAQPRPVAISR